MKQDKNTPDTDLISGQAAWLAGLYSELASLIAVAQTQLSSTSKAESAKAYRKLRNPILAQTTPANGIDIANRAVLSILQRDKATIAAGAEAGVRLLLALLDANLRGEYEQSRQASAERDATSELPAEHRFFFGELKKRGVTRSMLDALTQEELDVIAQLVEQKNANPTHSTLKGLWNFSYRAGIVDHKVIGLTDDEKAAILLVFRPDASAGMAALAFFDEAAGRKLDLPMPLALALIADMRAEKRSRGLRRTFDHLVADEYNQTTRIIRKALGLHDDQVAELLAAWSDVFDRHFDDIERRQAEAGARRQEEIRTFLPAAQALGIRDEQAAERHQAQHNSWDEDELDADEDAGVSGFPAPDDAGVVQNDGDDRPRDDEPLPDDAQQRAEMARDRAAWAASSERFEQLEDLERATQLHGSPFLRDEARRSGIAMPGDDPPAAQPPWAAAQPDLAASSSGDQPRSHRERLSAYLKANP